MLKCMKVFEYAPFLFSRSHCPRLWTSTSSENIKRKDGEKIFRETSLSFLRDSSATFCMAWKKLYRYILHFNLI